MVPHNDFFLPIQIDPLRRFGRNKRRRASKDDDNGDFT